MESRQRRSRVARRAWVRASDGLAHPVVPIVTGTMAPAAAAIQTAMSSSTAPITQSGTVAVHPSWQWVLLAALTGGVFVYLLTWIGLVLWHHWQYERAGRTHHLWDVSATLAGNAVQFHLEKHRPGPPVTLDKFGIMECIVTLPDGDDRTVGEHGGNIGLLRRGQEWIIAQLELNPPPFGIYRVSWHGSRGDDKPRFYEITTAEFTFPPDWWETEHEPGVTRPDPKPPARRGSLARVDRSRA